jgi:hypothetical protein
MQAAGLSCATCAGVVTVRDGASSVGMVAALLGPSQTVTTITNRDHCSALGGRCLVGAERHKVPPLRLRGA